MIDRHLEELERRVADANASWNQAINDLDRFSGSSIGFLIHRCNEAEKQLLAYKYEKSKRELLRDVFDCPHHEAEQHRKTLYKLVEAIYEYVGRKMDTKGDKSREKRRFEEDTSREER